MTEMKEQKEIPTGNKFEIINLNYDNLDDMYDIYLKNHSYKDEDLSGEDEHRLILNDESTYTYEEFRRICKDTKTAVLGLNELIPFTDYDIYHDKMVNEPIMLNMLRGFIIYEVLKEQNHKIYSIMFLEHDKDYMNEVYKHLSKFMKDKLVGSGKIRIEIEDGDYNVMRKLQENGFKNKKLVTSQKKNDVFIFELSL